MQSPTKVQNNGTAAVAGKGTVLAKLNIAFLVWLLVSVLVFLLWPSAVLAIVKYNGIASIVQCTFHNCKESESESGQSAILSHTETIASNRTTQRAPSFLDFITDNTKIGLVNMENDELTNWGIRGNSMMIQFDRVSSTVAWHDMFPQWSNEDISKSPQCPEIPIPDFTRYDEVDVVIARLPCRKPENGWNKDVFRLQVHMVSANLAVRKGRKDRNGTVKLIFLSKCTPMMDIFRCDDLVRSEGDWWMYEADVGKLEDKLGLPLGPCKFALPIWDEGNNTELNTSIPMVPSVPGRREAYATVMHSSDGYFCGAIILAQSIRRSGSTRDLLLLHDDSIPEDKLKALADAGWILRKITRIRNPHGIPGSYNEYNLSKFRLWQLTKYDKIVYVDADVLVLRNLDVLFSLPQMSAASDEVYLIFNAGIMVIEPSNCTFNVLLENRDNLTSYNYGDQGFLNENFVLWHRIPKRMNSLKYFPGITEEDMKRKEELFAAEPPRLYSIHYLGAKPWACSSRYDCNRDKDYFKLFVSDAAIQRWWKFYDTLDASVQAHCRRPET